MIDLLRSDLRDRDIRKLVEPHMGEVVWKYSEKSDSEWVLSDKKGFNDFQEWLSLQETEPDETVVVTNSSWSSVQKLPLSQLMDFRDQHFATSSCLIVNSNRHWVLQYHYNQIMRYGTWQNGT